MAKAAKKSAPPKSKAKAKKKVDKGVQKIETRVVVDTVDDGLTFYANYAEIACSENEFALIGARVPTKPSPEQMNQAKSTGELVVEAELQILFPPTVIPGLIDALKDQMQKYEILYGRSLSKTTAGGNNDK